MKVFLLIVVILAISIDGINSIWTPPPGTTWQWQLAGKPIDTSVNATVYDIDYYYSDKSLVDELHQKGRKVFCYINIGCWTSWYNDTAAIPKSAIGKTYPQWPNIKFLDYRNAEVRNIMAKRFDLCQSKGFDGVEGDNLDSYTHDTGFPLTANDAVEYGLWMASEAHKRGLSMGQKNVPQLTGRLEKSFDWAMTEGCGEWNFCKDMKPYLDHGKAVFDAEYNDKGFSAACNEHIKLSVLRKNLNLDAWNQRCP
jgi:hypothetical protein